MTREEILSKFKANGYSTSIDLSSTIATPKEENIVNIPPQDVTEEGLVAKTGGSLKNFLGGTVFSVSAPGRTIQNLLSKGVEKITGAEDFGQATKEGFEESTGVDLDTTSGKIGQFAGEAATFAIPAGFATKATKGASILAKIGAQGLSDAVVQSVNQGELNKNTIDAGIIGAAFPAGGALFSSAKKNFAPRIVNSLIKPLLKDFSYGKNPGKAVAEAGIVANSLDDLASKITSAKQQVGEEIGSVVKQSTKTFDIVDTLKPIDDALAKASKNPRTNSTAIKRLQDLKDDILRVTDEGIGRKTENVTAEEVFDLKKEIGELTRWTGNPSDDNLVNAALKRTYGRLKGKLEEVVDPALSEKYANLQSAEIATKYRDKIAARQGLISLSGTETGIGAGLITSVATGGITIPLLVGAGAAALTQASKTPAFKTRLAAWLAQAGKQEIQSAFKQAPWLRATLQSILFSEDADE